MNLEEAVRKPAREAGDEPPPSPAPPTSPAWVALLLALWALTLAYRVLPYLPTSGGDFEHLYRGAAALRAGESAFARPELDYPPLVPVLLAPLGGATLATARTIWFALSLAALVLAGWRLHRLAGGSRAATGALAAVLLLEGSAAPNLGLGQIHPLLMLLVVFALGDLVARPARAAWAIAGAAALKIWPGILLLAWLAGPRHARWIGWRTAAWVGALLVLLPLAILWATTPPPHLPLAHGYWFGTPALLNFSLPAAVLRLSDGWQPGLPPPRDWIEGVTSAWELAPDRRRLSFAIAALSLATGLGAIGWRLREARRKKRAEAPEASAVAVASALVALALVAAPISWYHYQLLQLPFFVLALARELDERRWLHAGATAALATLLTRHELLVKLFELFSSEETAALYRTGLLMPLLGLAWFWTRLWAIGRRQPTPFLA